MMDTKNHIECMPRYATKIFCTLLAIVTFLFAPEHLRAQKNGIKKPEIYIPLSTDIQKKILQNGLTCYISESRSAVNKVSIKFIVNAGQNNNNNFESAHLLEHMLARKDSLSPANSEFLINASTSPDHTQYDYEATSDSINIVSILCIIKKWLTQKNEIKNSILNIEKNIVAEEFRMKAFENQAELRFLKRLNNDTTPDIKDFELRLQNTSQEDIIDFYTRWYIPELSCVVIVGDIDKIKIEKMINRIFSEIPPRKIVAQKHTHLPHTKNQTSINQTIVETYADKYGNNSIIRLLFKDKKRTPMTRIDYKESLQIELCNKILNNRFSDLLQRGETGPIEYLTLSNRTDLQGRTGFEFFATSTQEKHLKESLKYLALELSRVQKYGFSLDELELAKNELDQPIFFSQLSNQDKATKILSNFIYNESILGDSIDREIRCEFTQHIRLNELNKNIRKWTTSSSMQIGILAPEKAIKYIPNESEIRTYFRKAKTANITPYKTTKKEIPKGSFKSTYPINKNKPNQTYKIDAIGITQLQLKNGIKIIIHENQSENKEVLIKASIPVGTLSYKEKSFFYSAKVAFNIILNTKLSELTGQELNTYKEANKIKLSATMEKQTTIITGSAPEDRVEILLQLFSRFFQPIQENDTIAYVATLNELKKNASANQINAISDTLSKALGFIYELENSLSYKELSNVSIQKCINIYNNCFASPRETVFAVSGAMQKIDCIIDQTSMYLGSIPDTDTTLPNPKVSLSRESKPINISITNEFTTTPKTDVTLIFREVKKTTTKDEITIRLLTEVLEKRLFQRLRQVEGGVYDLNTNLQLIKTYNDQNIILTRTTFACKPDRADRLVDIALDEIETLKQTPPNDSELNSALAKYNAHNAFSNFTEQKWCSYLLDQVRTNEDLTLILERDILIKSITPSDITQMATKFLNKKQLINYQSVPNL